MYYRSGTMAFRRLVLTLSALSLSLSATAVSVTSGERTLPVASLGAPNPWPIFRFQLKGMAISADSHLSGEDIAGLSSTTAVPTLPYLLQDTYTRVRRSGKLSTVTIENDALRVVLYPSLGGRLISLFDKTNGRELLFNNPVFQPANLAVRNAWFSGGIEWNGPLYGHSLLTCSPVYVGRVDTPRGPIVRIYAFDRVLETVWQVDLFLPDGERRLWAHVKARNPNDHDIRFYWWTNIALPMTPATRVIAPMDYAIAHVAFCTKNALLPSFPFFDRFDGSYPSRYPYSIAVFYRKPGRPSAWSACVEGDGRGLCHVSTSTLSGRKFFTWGTGRGGRRWMDYLSEEGRGDYLELQGGVTPTQFQTRLLKAGAHIEWTECFAPLALEAKKAHAETYTCAIAAAETAIAERVPQKILAETDDFLKAQTENPVDELLAKGSGWGYLHELLTGKRFSPGLRFVSSGTSEERPWIELLKQGTFSNETLKQQPHSFVVSPFWMTALERSVKNHGATWLHLLHLGNAQLEQGEFAKARVSFEASLARKPSALAWRNLALLAEREGSADAARTAYLNAWALCGNETHLAVEIGLFFERHNLETAREMFVSKLPHSAAEHERIQLGEARAALARGDDSTVRTILRREFCTIREGEESLTKLWFAAWTQEAENHLGRKLTGEEQKILREKHPPPRSIDFRMK